MDPSIPETRTSSRLRTAQSRPTAPKTNLASSKPTTIRLQPNGLAKPSRIIFDPWNSSTLGHQRAENRLAGSASWRASRNLKLGAQYRGGLCDGKMVSDAVGAGNEEIWRNGRKGNEAREMNSGGQRNIWKSFGGRRDTPVEGEGEGEGLEEADCSDGRKRQGDDTQGQEQWQEEQEEEQEAKPNKLIFQNLCIYVNGSTAPLISDHKLKGLLVKHGATLSIALSRRSVTHVIVGNAVYKGGAGGGLAGSKIQREITRIRGKGVKFISAEWAVQSINAGKRLPEARFSNTKLVAPSGQKSVLEAFKSAKPGQSAEKG